QHRRMRLLDRLRPRPEGREADQLALEARLLLGPDALHRLDALAEQLPAGAELRPVVLHLLGVPAATDAEQEAAAREEVERRDLLGGRDRVALDQEADARAELQPSRDRSRRRERDEEIMRVPVLLGKVRPTRPRAPS